MGRANRRRRPWFLAERYFYEVLGDGDRAHPVDVAVDRLPRVAALEKRVARARARLLADERVVALVRELTDLEQDLRTEREEQFFDAGYAIGRVAGRSEAQRLPRAPAAVAAALRRALLEASVGRDEALRALLREAVALLGAPPPGRRRGR